jgi:hypothetical protein
MTTYIPAVVAALLLGVSNAAQAEPPGRAAGTTTPNGSAPNWKQILETGESLYYIDLNGKRNTTAGGAASIIELVALANFKIPLVTNDREVKSIEFLIENDCSNHKIMTAKQTYYSMHMGTGDIVPSEPVETIWDTPQPGSLEQLFWTTACGAK